MSDAYLAQLIHISDVKLPQEENIELWRVTGLDGLWPTKIAAEKAARAWFPNEPAHIRYSRVFFVRYLRTE